MITLTILLAAAAMHAVTAVSIPSVFNDRSITRFLHLETKLDPPPIWNLANATTEDAKADGSIGVIIEPDLVEGEPGKDGGVVKKIRFGKYILQPGQKKEFPIGLYGLTPIERGSDTPCQDCYITAMQLNLEYPDGTIANVDTGAWYESHVLMAAVRLISCLGSTMSTSLSLEPTIPVPHHCHHSSNTAATLQWQEIASTPEATSASPYA
jgi:hypothetical protein